MERWQRLVGKRVGLAVSWAGQCRPNRTIQGIRHVRIDTHARLPATFNRLAWSNLAAQSAEQIALAAAPIVAVLLLGVGEGQTGLLQTALTLPFILFAIPAGLLADRISRRWLMAGSEALRAAALAGILLLIWLGAADAAAAGAARLRRGVRHGRLQRGRAGAGAVAGDAAAIARGQRADRTGAHHGVRQRPGARRRAGRMGRRRAGVRICRGALRRSRSCCCRASTSRPARPRRGAIRCRTSRKAPTSCCIIALLRPVFITQFIFNTASFLLLAVFVPYAVRHLGLSATGVGIDARRCTASAWWSARCWRRG